MEKIHDSTGSYQYIPHILALSRKPSVTKAYQVDLQQFIEFTQNHYDREHIQKCITQLHKQFKPQTATIPPLFRTILFPVRV